MEWMVLVEENNNTQLEWSYLFMEVRMLVNGNKCSAFSLANVIPLVKQAKKFIVQFINKEVEKKYSALIV